MRNKKGFTLAELLGVITILAIIALITVPLINKYITNSRKKAYDVQITTIVNAAKQWFTKNSTSVVWDEDGYYALQIDVLKSSEFLSDEKIYNPITPKEEITGCIMIKKDKSSYSYDYSQSCTATSAYNFVYNGTNGIDGSVQMLTIEKTGNYTIEATGAGGSVGNTYGLSSYTATPGLGARITSTFSLSSGDILYIIVGGVGSSTSNTDSDGVSGGGGGGTFIFKKITTVANANYQFSKSPNNYEILLVAAGGGGTCDLAYSGGSCSGYSGIGKTWYSPSNYVSFSNTTLSPSSSSSNSDVLGITQFINYDLMGNIYTRGRSYCKGGYGGGACADDDAAPGGGWSLSNNAATSFSSGNNTIGTSGTNSSSGTVIITKVG